MSDPLTPWQRAELALAVLAVDPAGVKGLWLRARSSAVRDRVTQARPMARRIPPGVDDTALFGGVDLAATLAAGATAAAAGIVYHGTVVGHGTAPEARSTQ
jgi:magnesium chelatase subunit D